MVTENDNPSNAPRSHATRSQAPVTRLTQSAATGDQRNRDGDVGVRRSKTTIGDDRRFQNARDDVIIEELDNEVWFSKFSVVCIEDNYNVEQ